MLFRNEQLGEWVTTFDGFTNSAYVPPPDLDKTNDNHYLEWWRNTQHYDMIPSILDGGTGFRIQVTNTAYPKTAPPNIAYSNYSSYSKIPMGQADVRIRNGETLVLASPNIAAGKTNRMVAFFTPTVYTPSKSGNDDRALGVTNAPRPQIHIKARFIKLSAADADAILTAGIAVDTKETNTVEILTDAKATALLRKLESRGGMETLGEPEVVTITGRQVKCALAIQLWI